MTNSRRTSRGPAVEKHWFNRRIAMKSVVAIRNTLGTQKLVVPCGLLVHRIQRHVAYLWRSLKDIVY
jgi:hypothetical protein